MLTSLTIQRLRRHDTLILLLHGQLLKVILITLFKFNEYVTEYNRVTNFIVVPLKINLFRKSWHLVAGHSAARDTNRGTPFVRAINDVFLAHAKSEHLLDLLTLVGINVVFFSSIFCN